MVSTVVLDKAVLKAVAKLPQYVTDKLLAWVSGVERYGLEHVRKIPGYHDEPLKGRRAGQRSVRLSRSYRAIYVIEQGAVRVELVRVIEVNKHDY